MSKKKKKTTTTSTPSLARRVASHPSTGLTIRLTILAGALCLALTGIKGAVNRAAAAGRQSGCEAAVTQVVENLLPIVPPAAEVTAVCQRILGTAATE